MSPDDALQLSGIASRMAQVATATARAHQAFLAAAGNARANLLFTARMQAELLERLAFDHAETSDEMPLEEVQPRGVLNRAQCLEFAIGRIANVLGPAFAEIDNHPTRVRLPDEPLMLVDRILTIEGEPKSLTAGRVVTEHDILPGAWYLDGGHAPACIAVEAGQADLFLSGYLGIDFQTKGLRTYRLLDATVEFHRELPKPGETARYDISIDRFIRRGDTWLFFFEFDATIDGRPMLTMRDGCAGFFTAEEIHNSQGIVLTQVESPLAASRERHSTSSFPVSTFPPETYVDAALAALRSGDLAGCFGTPFEQLKLTDPLRLPGGRMKLIDRVLELDPAGGRFGLGLIRAEADIHPDDWFLTCHFMDDMVMPGTLMHECCVHTLRFYLLRMGWVANQTGVSYQPVPGVRSVLKCRGPVTQKTKKVHYQIELKEIGYRPEPYVIADADMFSDGKHIVRFVDMSLRMAGMTRERIESLWSRVQGTEKSRRACSSGHVPREQGVLAERLLQDGVSAQELTFHSETAGRASSPAPFDRPSAPSFPNPEPRALNPELRTLNPLFAHDRILAFAVGKPSEAFGEPYRIFDEKRRIARLPGPPYQFLDRITAIDAEPWVLKPTGWIEAEYDVPPDAWYFRANRQPSMPFCVLLEVALQPCGWLAAYLGSALRSELDLRFRNLGGTATLHEEVFPHTGTLTTRVRMTSVSEAGGMIIQKFEFQMTARPLPPCQGGAGGGVSETVNPRVIYEGETSFGFFTDEALAKQVGLRNVAERRYQSAAEEQARARRIQLPDLPPFTPDDPQPQLCHAERSEASPALDSENYSREERLRFFASLRMTPGAILAHALPARALRMIDEVELFLPVGGLLASASCSDQIAGPHRLGFLHGTKSVNPSDWFFKAHFHQDPVWPGSLGLESFLQLLKTAALQIWGEEVARTHRFECIALGSPHTWFYRGQILPTNRHVQVEALVTDIRENPDPLIIAEGFLFVDGLAIYEMRNFGIRMSRSDPPPDQSTKR